MLRVNTYALLRLIAISSLVSTTTAQFKMADFGDPCINYENPFEPGKVCYYSKGLDCTGFSNFGGPVCSCYGGFVYDPVRTPYLYSVFIYLSFSGYSYYLM
jgi:hypothetical protein